MTCSRSSMRGQQWHLLMVSIRLKFLSSSLQSDLWFSDSAQRNTSLKIKRKGDRTQWGHIVCGQKTPELITITALPSLPLSRAKPEPQGGLSEASRGGEGHGDIRRGSPLIGRRTPCRRSHGRRVEPLGTNVKRSNISSPPEWSDFT